MTTPSYRLFAPRQRNRNTRRFITPSRRYRTAQVRTTSRALGQPTPNAAITSPPKVFRQDLAAAGSTPKATATATTTTAIQITGVAYPVGKIECRRGSDGGLS